MLNEAPTDVLEEVVLQAQHQISKAALELADVELEELDAA
jgi:hypothetical protein